MAFTLRLSEHEQQMLKTQAEREHRSMHDVVRLAVIERASQGERNEWIDAHVDHIMQRDAEILRRLSL